MTLEEKLDQMSDHELERDRLKYIKNQQSAVLCYFAILFDAIFFVIIYQQDVGNWYYQWLIGVSIVYNLVFLLAAFLAEEGVKNYKKNYSYMLFLLGAGQIIRIFIFPRLAHAAYVVIGGVEVQVMGNSTFIILIVFALLSAGCLILAGIINIQKCNEIAEPGPLDQVEAAT